MKQLPSLSVAFAKKTNEFDYKRHVGTLDARRAALGVHMNVCALMI